jgi:translation initiation factor 2 alpha subunit (eIF-2alpha)
MSSGIFCDCTCDHICTLKRNKTHIRLSIKINIKKKNKLTKKNKHKNKQNLYEILQLCRGRCGLDRMADGFTFTYVSSIYHH